MAESLLSVPIFGGKDVITVIRITQLAIRKINHKNTHFCDNRSYIILLTFTLLNTSL